MLGYYTGSGGGDFSRNFGNTSSSSNVDHSDSDADIPPPPSPPSVHTRLQKGIHHPKQYTDGTIRYGILSSTGEPYNLTEALADQK
jgi:hypothetical protein